MSENWIPEEFETAEVTMTENGGRLLVVRGKTAGGEIRLAPVDYVAMPDYWQIDVISDSAESTPRSYEISLTLGRICGSKGIEVFGRETSVKIDIA